ncbi:CLUMA_CG002464, isoform A [Clunio marinus]|uniref:CLUMA_CG002464, isoform A n=1 Tax=Clunio marinus TaxID=568069 RepID=A0A1J1HKQ7_9DIPT|nr:CLUMA_CG002464, isoform A [Clunio marinus]
MEEMCRRSNYEAPTDHFNFTDEHTASFSPPRSINKRTCKASTWNEGKKVFRNLKKPGKTPVR